MAKKKKPMQEVDDQGVAHSIIGASSMYRVEICPGSVRLHQELIESGWQSKSSVASRHGTAVHELIEICIGEDLIPESFIGKTHEKTGHTYTERDAECVHIAAAAIAHFTYDEYDDIEPMLETRFALPSVDAEAFGTGDIALVVPFEKGVILDYKNGRGKVYVKDNLQLLFYAIGLADEYDLEEVTIGVIQPNTSGEEPFITLDADALNEARQRLRNIIASARDENAKIQPDSKACHFCPAKEAGTCLAIRSKQANDIRALLASPDEDLPELLSPESNPALDVTMPLYDEMDPSKIKFALENRKLLIDWFDGLKTYVEDSFEETPIEGFYMKRGRRGDMKWTDEEAVKDAYYEVQEGMEGNGVDCYEKKILTPSKMKKLVGKAVFEKTFSCLTSRKDGKLALAVDDRTEEVRLEELVKEEDFDL